MKQRMLKHLLFIASFAAKEVVNILHREGQWKGQKFALSPELTNSLHIFRSVTEDLKELILMEPSDENADHSMIDCTEEFIKRAQQ